MWYPVPMEMVQHYCREMLAEHAQLSPLDHQPEINAFVALIGIQQALHEQNLPAPNVIVRQVALQGGSASFTICVALVLEHHVLGVHGAVGWTAVGKVGARIQSTFGPCGGFAGMGKVEECWSPQRPPNMDGEDAQPFREWIERCRAHLAAVLLDRRASPAPLPRQPGRL